MRVMVLDDSAVMRKIVIRSLRAAGIDVGEPMECSSGEEGVGALIAGAKPELIVSDVNMGGMDGIAFVKKARERIGPAACKIMMITTEGGADKVRAAMDAGANGYLTKPFTPEQVADALKKMGL